ncbi:MAG: SMC-Scp complex subunit ScpB [Candidatus Acidiferrum sp.]
MTGLERKAALEAIIYAADEPATLDQLATALGEDKLPVKAALDDLIASYSSDDRGIEVRAVAGGYKMYTKAQHHDVVRRFIKSLRPPLRLSMPALETLAVIAYKQPVTAPEISEIRGVNASGVISTLLDKKLITTAGRKEVIGRPILYKTSKEFLMRFGLSDLDELPSLKEFEALAREALGADEVVAVDISEDQVSELHPQIDLANADAPNAAIPPADSSPASTTPPARHSERSEVRVSIARPLGDESLLDQSSEQTSDAISETIHHVEQELTAAEQFREHEAAATSEGMPSGTLDEDPPPPNAKSTSAG